MIILGLLLGVGTAQPLGFAAVALTAILNPGRLDAYRRARSPAQIEDDRSSRDCR
jgi:hypothetical protein